MVSEDRGEWKLLKVWECKGCKLLIKDGRRVFDHECGSDDREKEFSDLRNVIEDKNKAIDEANIIIEQQRNNAKGLEDFIKELNKTITNNNNILSDKEKIIEEQKNIIETNKKVIDGQKNTIAEQDMTIEKQKKNQNKVVEKVVYLNGNNQRVGTDEDIQNINVDIWQKHLKVKDSKDNGYREDIEIEIFERGRGKEKIIIKNGKVLKKPDDIIVIGKQEQEGFVIKGIYRN